MISNQILQNTIDGLKAITRTDLCVIDVEKNSGRDISGCRTVCNSGTDLRGIAGGQSGGKWLPVL